MKKKISLQHLGNYYIAMKPLAKLVDYELITPPPLTRKTIEIGCKYSPESVCIPFKYQLGNYIEAIENGANVLIQAGGGCRFGYYAEVQEEILKSLGYKVEILKLQNNYGLFAIIKRIKELNPKLSYFKIVKAVYIAYRKATAIECIEDLIRKNIGFEKNSGQFELAFKKFLVDLDRAETADKIKRIKNDYLEKFSQVDIDKPKNPIKVAVVGEVYIVMEPFSNFNLEKNLGRKGVEIHRFVTASNLVVNAIKIFNQKEKMRKLAEPYLKYHIGGHGTESVGLAHKLIREGFDGIIHVKPFGCIPEINAMPALYNLSKDYKIPIIYFSFDSLTSEAGVETRLDAFYDMLVMKKKNNEKALFRN